MRHSTPLPPLRRARRRQPQVGRRRQRNRRLRHGPRRPAARPQHPAVVEAVAAQAAARHALRRVARAGDPLGRTGAATRALRRAPALHLVRHRGDDDGAAPRARLHRAARKLLRLREHFHGWNDSVTGQPAPEETLPASPGLPRGILEASIVIPQNDVAIARAHAARGRRRDRRDDLRDRPARTGAPSPIDLDYVRRARELTRAARHRADLRRSDHGLPRRAGRRPAGLRRHARHDDDGEDPRRRAARAAASPAAPTSSSRSPSATDDVGDRIAHPGTFNANPLSAAAGAACLAADRGRRAPGARGHDRRRARARDERASSARSRSPAASTAHRRCCTSRSAWTQQPPDGYSWGWAPAPLPASARCRSDMRRRCGSACSTRAWT